MLRNIEYYLFGIFSLEHWSVFVTGYKFPRGQCDQELK